MARFLFLLLFVSTALLISARTWAAERPNVLLVITDDQGFGDVHSHGNAIVQTPVMDALAVSGARFDRYFVSPVCAPTRASLLTGRYHLRTGVSGVTRGYENLRDEEWTLAEMFASAGYVTGAFGKWHNGRHMPYHPNGQGFETFFGFCGGHWNSYFDAPLELNGEPVQTKGYINDVVTDQAIRFMKQSRRRPFFCYVPYNTPHSPWCASDRLWRNYDSRGLDAKAQAAYAMVESIDENLGRLLATLDELGKANNTIVLFMTDNGANSPRYNAGMRGRKGSIDEGGMRVPLFVRHPGVVTPRTIVRRNAFHLDILPTLADWCGIAIPNDIRRQLDGSSLAPLLKPNLPVDWPDRRFFSIRHRPDVEPQDQRGAVRTDRWRATRSSRRWRLYDMQQDPSQEQDIAADHPEVIEDLSADFERWLASVTKGSLAPPPIPLGHPQRAAVELPPNEATLTPGYGEGIKWTGDTDRGFANCWIHEWTSDDAYPEWRVKFLTPGRYAFSLEYTCEQEDVGVQMKLEVGGQTLVQNVGRYLTSPLQAKPDRFFSSNYQDKQQWAELRLGELVVNTTAETTIRLRTKIVRNKSIDLRRIRVSKLK